MDINISDIKQSAKAYIFLHKPHTLVFSFVFYFFKTIYRIVNIVTLGISSLIFKPLVFPYDIKKAYKYINFVKKKKVNIWSLFQGYTKVWTCIKHIFLKFCILFIAFALGLFFVMPGIYFYLNFFFLDFVIASNEKITNKQAIKKCLCLTKNGKKELFYFFFSFFGWYLLSIISLGLTSSYGTHYFYISKILYFNKLQKLVQTDEKEKRMLVVI